MKLMPVSNLNELCDIKVPGIMCLARQINIPVAWQDFVTSDLHQGSGNQSLKLVMAAVVLLTRGRSGDGLATEQHPERMSLKYISRGCCFLP